MAAKLLSDTDISKKAIVVTGAIEAVFDQHSGGTPKVRGDKPLRTSVRAFFRNIGAFIDLHFYGSERAGSGRAPEERCWATELNGIARAGLTFEVEYVNGRFELEIR